MCRQRGDGGIHRAAFDHGHDRVPQHDQHAEQVERAAQAERQARIIGGERICGVLMLTAFSQREVVEDARDAGALAYLVKPYQKSDLIPAIEVAIVCSRPGRNSVKIAEKTSGMSRPSTGRRRIRLQEE